MHLAVLECKPSEAHHEFGVRGNVVEVGLLVHELEERQPEDMRSDDDARSFGVVVDRIRVATDRVEEAMDLALGVVEAPGTGPPVAPPVDGVVPMRRADTIQLGRQHVERRVPIDLDEGLIAAALRVRTGAVAKPGLPDRGTRDPIASYRLERLPDWRRVRVFGERVDSGDVVTVGLDLVGTPMRQCPVSRRRHECRR